MTKEGSPVKYGENEMREYSVTEISPMGFGNPDSKISYDKKKLDSDFEMKARTSYEIIKSGECMVKITDSDDGCIDGRKANTLLFPRGIEGKDYNEVAITNPAEHHRAKVAGGGYLTASFMYMALDDNQRSHTIEDTIAKVAEHLTEQGTYCGTHTGKHLNDECADCGANDRVQEIVEAAVVYAEPISEAIGIVMEQIKSDPVPKEMIDDTNQSVNAVSADNNYFSGSNGISRFKAIMMEIMKAQEQSGVTNKSVAVSKNLDGEHQEASIIINTVEGKTFSQADHNKKMAEQFPNDDLDSLPQVFVVDVPRVVELAHAMAHGRDDEDMSFQKALYAGLVYQFATAAVLTDGSLPMFVIQ